MLLENYFLPGDLKMQIGDFIDHYNNHRYHESLNNVTPADTYFGRDAVIIQRREKIKKLTIQKRRLNHQRKAALHQTKMSRILCYKTDSGVPNVLMTDSKGILRIDVSVVSAFDPK